MALKNEIFTVSDAKDYYHASNGRVLRPGRIVVKPLQPSFDIFRCLYFSGGNRFYVSSHLKQAMEHAGITGVSFESMQCHEVDDL
jgi:hypothetical protein